MKQIIKEFFDKMAADGLIVSESVNGHVEALLATVSSKIEEAKNEGKTVAEKVLFNCAEAVKKQLESDYKLAVENLIKSMDELHEAKMKLAMKKADQKKNKKLAEDINTYINMTIKELLPESLVVDYSKFKRQTKIIESLKQTLIITDEQIHEAAATVTESISQEKSDLKKQLDEALKQNIVLTKIVENNEASAYLADRLKDLPQLESKKMAAYFAECSKDEIEKNFESVLKTVKKSLSEESVKDSELENEIKEIIDDKSDKKPEDKPADEKKPDEKTDESKKLVDPSILRYVRIIEGKQ